MEFKGLAYQYIEVDPYKKPVALMEVNPRGLVPALRHGDWSCHESTVLMEYVRDINCLGLIQSPTEVGFSSKTCILNTLCYHMTQKREHTLVSGPIMYVSPIQKPKPSIICIFSFSPPQISKTILLFRPSIPPPFFFFFNIYSRSTVTSSRPSIATSKAKTPTPPSKPN